VREALRPLAGLPWRAQRALGLKLAPEQTAGLVAVLPSVLHLRGRGLHDRGAAGRRFSVHCPGFATALRVSNQVLGNKAVRPGV
jgi:hypothetical protein